MIAQTIPMQCLQYTEINTNLTGLTCLQTLILKQVLTRSPVLAFLVEADVYTSGLGWPRNMMGR